MTREQAINYLRSSAFSDEQIVEIEKAFSNNEKVEKDRTMTIVIEDVTQSIKEYIVNTMESTFVDRCLGIQDVWIRDVAMITEHVDNNVQYTDIVDKYGNSILLDYFEYSRISINEHI